ncbi:MAG TPA: glycosyl hydrolase family 18 protein, partial [Polyangia bacterium]|nr:glycosyl hydrolase family 18 protein [Polyangia bacterium]
GTIGTTTGTTTTPHAQHKRCAWIGADTFAAGKASFLANPDWFDAIHPVWYSLQPGGSIAPAGAIVDDADLMAAAHAHGVKVIPLINGNSVDYMRAAMATPDAITAHAQALATLAQTHGYDGLELDYEHLFLATDRVPYTALIAAVATALHAQGKVLTLALPAMSAANPASAYDYASLQGTVDVMHLMGYDFHYLGGDHLGPIAPLGWIQDVTSYVATLGAAGKYSLGVANYGIGTGWYADAATAAAGCLPGTFSEQTDHMTVCPLGHQEAGIAPHCTTAQGDVWFENADSAAQKTALAKAAGFGGVAYYTLGDEPAGFLDALAASF